MNIRKQVLIVAALFACLQPNSLRSQTNWIDHPNNPVINSEFDPGALFIQRPSVLFDGDSYHMWYASVRLYLIVNTQIKLNCMGYATSPDGISWSSVTPVAIEPSFDGNAFDQMYAGQGWVIAVNDTFKMWYRGLNPSFGERGLNSIGYAWSLDGSNWTRVAGPGALGSVYDLNMAGLPDSLGMATPCVVKTGDTYHMWYSQFDLASSTSRIGYARSSDGIHWTKVNGTGQNGSVIDLGPPGSFDQLTASWPDVIKTDEGFMMWYYGNDGTKSRIGCSISSDGIQWNRAPGVDASGACFEGALGVCVIPGDIQYKMWYSPDNSNLVNLAFSNYTTDIKKIENPAGKETFALKQNYPNPFNPTTTIKYSIPKESHVVLKVYDALAKEVTTLVNKKLRPGNYQIEFDGSSLSSGIYFYQMITDGFLKTKKLLLLK